MTDFSDSKMFQVTYFVIECEANFSKVPLDMMKCTCVWCSPLENSLASNVKPSRQPKHSEYNIFVVPKP